MTEAKDGTWTLSGLPAALRDSLEIMASQRGCSPRDLAAKALAEWLARNGALDIGALDDLRDQRK